MAAGDGSRRTALLAGCCDSCDFFRVDEVGVVVVADVDLDDVDPAVELAGASRSRR